MTEIFSQPKGKNTHIKDNQSYLNRPKRSIPTLRDQLLKSILPTILLSLGISSFFGNRLVARSAQERTKLELRNQALLASEETKNILNNLAELPEITALNPLTIKTAIDRAQSPEALEIANLSIEELEKKFLNSKIFKPDPILNDYLAKIARAAGAAELVFTDVNGFNLASSKPPSDFVQRDELWWRKAKSQGQWIGEPDYDASSQIFGIELVKAIKNPSNGNFIGAVKSLVPISQFDGVEIALKHGGIRGTQQVQLIDSKNDNVINTITPEGGTGEREIIGKEFITEIAKYLNQVSNDSNSTSASIYTQLKERYSLPELKVNAFNNRDRSQGFVASFIYEDRQYNLATIPQTIFVVSASMEKSEIQASGNNLLLIYLASGLLLAAATAAIISFLADRLSFPLVDLAATAEKIALGDLNLSAKLHGTREMQTLASSFNNLIDRLKILLQQQEISLQELARSRQEAIDRAEQQNIELVQLLEKVEDASEGDLTVRAEITPGEIGVVADFFNSIIESLREIVVQVKQAADRVNISLTQNEIATRQLTGDALRQANRSNEILAAVETMTRSIENVASSAQATAEVARVASRTAQTGGETMEKTVTSILELRETVAETGKKVKRLGESSQQISKVVSLIDQIAMQTNLLAINASIEAARAGQEGKGFAVVAEEVGELATQSAAATKEIEQIVENIQIETNSVVEAMEIGTAQVVEGSRLVEQTKTSLAQIVEVSRQIDRLVQSISTATVSQTTTSAAVKELVREIVRISEATADSSQKVSHSLQQTVEVSKNLQQSVGTFKVDAKT
jgi:twitching motility protein PilJ